MKKVLDYLRLLDLSETEAKMYTALLDTGPMNVNALAHSVGIKRSTAYFYIDPLVERGLFVRIVKKSQKLIALSDPDSLQHLVKEKSATLEKIEKEFPDVLKTITTALAQTKGTDEAEIKYYKGKQGVKKIYEEVLKAKEIRSFVNIEEILEIFPENAKLFDNANTYNPEMKMFEIVEYSPRARERVKTSNKSKNYFYKFFPDNIKITSTDILIYDGKVSFINLKDQINGVILHNKDFYNNFKILFDLLWKMLPE